MMAYLIKPYRDCISACYDSKGNLYEIPNYCINPPYKYIESSFDQSFEEKEINLRIRHNMTEYKLKQMTSSKIADIKSILTKNISNKGDIIAIRLFYNGKELRDTKNLSKVQNNAIIQMMVNKSSAASSVKQIPKIEKIEEEKKSKNDLDDLGYDSNFKLSQFEMMQSQLNSENKVYLKQIITKREDKKSIDKLEENETKRESNKLEAIHN